MINDPLGLSGRNAGANIDGTTSDQREDHAVFKILLAMLTVIVILALSALLRLSVLPFRVLRAFWRYRTALVRTAPLPGSAYQS